MYGKAAILPCLCQILTEKLLNSGNLHVYFRQNPLVFLRKTPFLPGNPLFPAADSGVFFRSPFKSVFVEMSKSMDSPSCSRTKFPFESQPYFSGGSGLQASRRAFRTSAIAPFLRNGFAGAPIPNRLSAEKFFRKGKALFIQRSCRAYFGISRCLSPKTGASIINALPPRLKRP